MGTPIDKTTMQPFYFMKDPGSLVESGATISYPPGTRNLHHEMEWVIAIGKPGFRVDRSAAGDMIFGYAAGLDMTRRDLQAKAKDLGRPWDVAKNFEQAAVCSEIVPRAETTLGRGRITLQVNGETRQSSDLSMLIWSVDELIADLTRLYHLEPGDLIYTGTPEGVGPVEPGDHLYGKIDGVGEIRLSISGDGQPAQTALQ